VCMSVVAVVRDMQVIAVARRHGLRRLSHPAATGPSGANSELSPATTWCGGQSTSVSPVDLLSRPYQKSKPISTGAKSDLLAVSHPLGIITRHAGAAAYIRDTVFGRLFGTHSDLFIGPCESFSVFSFLFFFLSPSLFRLWSSSSAGSYHFLAHRCTRANINLRGLPLRR